MLGTQTVGRGAHGPVSPEFVGATGIFLRALISALHTHEGAIGEHGYRTAEFAVKAALELGLENVSRVHYAALLHDVGKLCVPRPILRKPGGLSEAEWRVMHRHPRMGADLLMGVAGFGPARTVILAHHERFDGGGYPLGLAGTGIPVEARSICVVDAFDAMTSGRPYRSAMSHAEAVEQLKLGAGTQFDPAMIEAVDKVLG